MAVVSKMFHLFGRQQFHSVLKFDSLLISWVRVSDNKKTLTKLVEL